MNQSSYKKTIAIVIATLAVAAGGFFGIRWEAMRYKKLDTAYAISLRALDFLSVEFPDQVTDYKQKLNATGKR